MTEIKRTHHPDGTMESEVTLVDGQPHGVSRHWHLSGVLGHEIPLVDGLIDGVVKQWNDQGKLLGTCELKRGTGVYRVWHMNGTLMGETPMVDGKWNGRQRAYFEDGKIAGETYWIANEKVSKKRYFEACKQNSNLPQYADASQIPAVRSSKTRTAKAPFDPTATNDELPLKLLQGHRVREALAWLQEGRESSRSLGEATGHVESIRLVEKLYSLGAVVVHAVEIAGDAAEDQNAGRLVIELPQAQGKRRKLLKFCGALARNAGFDPEPDMAQRYTLLMLD